jgi:nitric oxide reductase subunit C
MRWVVLVSLLIVLAGCARGGVDASRGEGLYNQLLIGGIAPGCIACHSIEAGVVKVGPSHAGIAQHAAEIIQSPAYKGPATTVEGFLRESILRPDVYVEFGFEAGLMYSGYEDLLSTQDVGDLVTYLMTLR